tara:strand:+ start:999 stop:1688 length:690 start_codon:yes stop_codon:yes gene_type:complete
MVKINFKQIDLLRKRRDSSNLPDQYFIDTNKFIKNGIFSGLVLILISLILGIPFIFRTKYLENQKNKIKVFTDEYDSLVEKIDKESKLLKEIAKFNRELKNSIMNISSSSALLKEISLNIPKDIQLLELTSKGNSLFMQSKVNNEKYLASLNSFLLSLDNSEFFEFDEIDLKEIKSINSNTEEKEYSFDIKTKISTKYSQLNKNHLIKLGSYGLFNRLNLLNNIEGISD